MMRTTILGLLLLTACADVEKTAQTADVASTQDSITNARLKSGLVPVNQGIGNGKLSSSTEGSKQANILVTDSTSNFKAKPNPTSTKNRIQVKKPN